MGFDFHETIMGKKFFNQQLPKLIQAINRNAAAIEKQNELFLMNIESCGIPTDSTTVDIDAVADELGIELSEEEMRLVKEKVLDYDYSDYNNYIRKCIEEVKGHKDMEEE